MTDCQGWSLLLGHEGFVSGRKALQTASLLDKDIMGVEISPKAELVNVKGTEVLLIKDVDCVYRWESVEADIVGST
jgi:hypothetical protein